MRRVERTRRLARTCLTAFMALLLGLAAATLAGLGSWTPRAVAAAPPLVEVALSSIDPAVPSRDGTIALSGRVTNTTKQPLSRLQVLLWRSQSPITDLAGLDEALSSDADQPLGRRLFRQAGAYQDLYTPDRPSLAPGASATFTVTAEVAALALPPTDGVYLMGVHVLQDGNRVAVGRSRVFVPVLDHQPPAPLRTATLVAFNSRPSLLGPGLLADDHLAREIAPDGRLRALLDAAQAKDVSYAVDPALVSELQTMRDGYQVRRASGATMPGPGQADAARWLTELSQLRSGHDGYRLLFASPDVAALAHARDTRVLKAAAAAGRRVAAASDLPLLVLPAAGAADHATLEAATALKPRAVLLSDAATAGAGPLLNNATGAPVLSYVAGGAGGGPGPDPQDDAVHTRQRALATSWLTLTGPNPQRAAQVHLVQTKGDIASLGRGDAPWSKPASLSAVLDQVPIRWSGTLSYPKALRAAELNAQHLAATKRLEDAARTWQDLLDEPDDAEAAADAMTARSASSGWRQDQAAASAYLQPQQASLDQRLDQVRISSIRRTTTTAQQGVTFPITIRNNLVAAHDGGATDPMAVRVQLRFVSDNPARLKVDPVTATAIEPDGGYTANAKVTAKANGTVTVNAQLYTVHGYKVGRPVPVEVHVTQNGTTGWAIAAAAGIVLLCSTTWRIRQVGREQTHRATTPRPDPDPALASVSATQLDRAHDDTEVAS